MLATVAGGLNNQQPRFPVGIVFVVVCLLQGFVIFLYDAQISTAFDSRPPELKETSVSLSLQLDPLTSRMLRLE